MSRGRWIATAAMLAALGLLLGWQRQRDHIVVSCRASGGTWNGKLSVCQPAPPGVILRRDLERS